MKELNKQKSQFAYTMLNKHLKWWDKILFRIHPNWFKNKIFMLEKNDMGYFNPHEYGISIYGKKYWHEDYSYLAQSPE